LCKDFKIGVFFLFLQLVFFYVSVSAWVEFNLAWSTYPDGMTENKCGIHQSTVMSIPHVSVMLPEAVSCADAQGA
jgi:hypothetical protein